MITKEDILKMTKHIVKRDRGIPDKRIMHPVRDWFIGLSFATVVFLIGSGYLGILFLDKLNEETETIIGDVSITQYNQEAVSSALSYYQNRVVQFEALRERGRILVPIIVDEETGDDGIEGGDGENAEDEVAE